jgi:hypothetical protein
MKQRMLVRTPKVIKYTEKPNKYVFVLMPKSSPEVIVLEFYLFILLVIFLIWIKTFHLIKMLLIKKFFFVFKQPCMLFFSREVYELLMLQNILKFSL